MKDGEDEGVCRPQNPNFPIRFIKNKYAERQGFEPWIGVTYTRFPGVRLQPLGHLSDQI